MKDLLYQLSYITIIILKYTRIRFINWTTLLIGFLLVTTNVLQYNNLVGALRLELRTYRLKADCSRQLSYTPVDVLTYARPCWACDDCLPLSFLVPGKRRGYVWVRSVLTSSSSPINNVLYYKLDLLSSIIIGMSNGYRPETAVITGHGTTTTPLSCGVSDRTRTCITLRCYGFAIRCVAIPPRSLSKKISHISLYLTMTHVDMYSRTTCSSSRRIKKIIKINFCISKINISR